MVMLVIRGMAINWLIKRKTCGDENKNNNDNIDIHCSNINVLENNSLSKVITIRIR